MLRLEEIKKDSILHGVAPGTTVRVISVDPVGSDSITVYYINNNDGKLGERVLYQADEPSLEEVQEGRPWSFDGSADDFKLVAEAYRIHLAHLFDPHMAVHSSTVEPLPHQVTAVYEEMLMRQPLRYLLADDPGAGKTIMAGLLIRELMVRGDLYRCLVVAPGNLAEQWQDELSDKFDLQFDIFSRDMVELTRSGNPFEDRNLLIARLDQLSRSDDLKAKLEASEWDMVIVDEAHKMSARWQGRELRKTKRYELGELLGDPARTRHFLLLTATPHNGKEEDFQTFMALLDADRFHGKFNEDRHTKDATDLMRRMVKEELVKFDNTRLFPERRAYTVNYDLSPLETDLYEAVTSYVVDEMRRADGLDGKRRGTVGFALTILQRRLASSPEAIYRSLERRHKKLLVMLEEAKKQSRSLRSLEAVTPMTAGEIDEILDEIPDSEIEELEEQILNQATAARSIPELQEEIASLKTLVAQAAEVYRAGEDRKWQELSRLLQDGTGEMYDEHGNLRKLIIFTEHRDTLTYLCDKVSGLLGSEDAIAVIHGGVKREDRRKEQERFTQEKDVLLLIATDAAGEGINLQRANLMVNYDLPWNPNRLEQRFGRIHRIGQTEVCHLWNLVAKETREGDVFERLFDKLEQVRNTLKGRVFDILGEAFHDRSLKSLIVDAIRYGEQPEKRAELHKKVDEILNLKHLHDIIERNTLAVEHMGEVRLSSLREQMERAEALKLQPFFILDFFREAFKRLGGQLKPRESDRYEITHVPAKVRSHNQVADSGQSVLRRYERICFDKSHVHTSSRLPATLVGPGHPLMASVIGVTLEKHSGLLKRGTILIDPTDEGMTPRVLFIIDHSIHDATAGGPSAQHPLSRRMQFVLIDSEGNVSQGGHAPYLDYEAADEDEIEALSSLLDEDWLKDNLEPMAVKHAVDTLAKEHLNEVQTRRKKMIDLTLDAVHKRLTNEISYWSRQLERVRIDVEAGKQPQVQLENMRRRVEELTNRLEQRTKELNQQKHIQSSRPIVVGGALVVPRALVEKLMGRDITMFTADADARKRIEEAAMCAVMDAERALGHKPEDISTHNYGWDIQSRTNDGSLRFIEVKGRAKGAEIVTVTKNEILAALNQPKQFILAIVLVDDENIEGPFYVRRPFDYIQRPSDEETDLAFASINCDMSTLLQSAERPLESTS